MPLWIDLDRHRNNHPLARPTPPSTVQRAPRALDSIVGIFLDRFLASPIVFARRASVSARDRPAASAQKSRANIASHRVASRRRRRAYPKSAWAMSRTLYSRPAVEVSTTHMDELMVRGCGGVRVCGIVTSRRRRGRATFTRDSGGVRDGDRAARATGRRRLVDYNAASSWSWSWSSWSSWSFVCACVCGAKR